MKIILHEFHAGLNDGYSEWEISLEDALHLIAQKKAFPFDVDYIYGFNFITVQQEIDFFEYAKKEGISI